MAIAEQPHDLRTVDVVVHPGTKQLRQTVPVEVTVGQLTAELQAFVEVMVVGLTTVDTCTTVEIWTTVVTTVVGK